jgi:hypothetical protein
MMQTSDRLRICQESGGPRRAPIRVRLPCYPRTEPSLFCQEQTIRGQSTHRLFPAACQACHSGQRTFRPLLASYPFSSQNPPCLPAYLRHPSLLYALPFSEWVESAAPSPFNCPRRPSRCHRRGAAGIHPAPAIATRRWHRQHPGRTSRRSDPRRSGRADCL